MNIGTILLISIQLKLINTYDPIFMLVAIKKCLGLKAQQQTTQWCNRSPSLNAAYSEVDIASLCVFDCTMGAKQRLCREEWGL